MQEEHADEEKKSSMDFQEEKRIDELLSKKIERINNQRIFVLA